MLSKKYKQDANTKVNVYDDYNCVKLHRYTENNYQEVKIC